MVLLLIGCSSTTNEDARTVCWFRTVASAFSTRPKITVNLESRHATIIANINDPLMKIDQNHIKLKFVLEQLWILYYGNLKPHHSIHGIRIMQPEFFQNNIMKKSKYWFGLS
jgi:hypothetical protein